MLHCFLELNVSLFLGIKHVLFLGIKRVVSRNLMLNVLLVSLRTDCCVVSRS